MKQDSRWLVLIGLLLIGTPFAIANGWYLLSYFSFAKPVEFQSAGQNRGRYYRFKASLTYKGEPLEFNIVVGCNVSVTTYKDNDRTVEVGVAPMVYGLKMKDGRGVVIKPPEACQGETTENGKVPTTLLPMVVTYEDADKPWFGLAYMSEDAYDSPISELKFFGATISRASFEEWQEWRKTEAPKNFVTYELLGTNAKNRFDHIRWAPGFRVMSSLCTGFSWVKLPEPVREAMRAYWPTGKPRYWYPGDKARAAFYASGDFHLGKVLFEGHPLREYFPTEANFFAGLPRHKPGALIFFSGRVAGDIYPAASDFSLDRLDAAGELPADIKAKPKKSYADVSVEPKFKGFAYCDRVYNIDGIPSSIGDLVPKMNRVNGEPIDDEHTQAGVQSAYAFERDEYVLFYRRYEMVNIVFGGL